MAFDTGKYAKIWEEKEFVVLKMVGKTNNDEDSRKLAVFISGEVIKRCNKYKEPRLMLDFAGIGGVGLISRPARMRYAKDITEINNLKKVALLGASRKMQVVVKFILMFNKSGFKLKFFKNREKAVRWLQRSDSKKSIKRS